MFSPASQKNTTLKDLFFLTPLAFFFLVFHLGRGSIASWDEGLYASVAKEIVSSGNWLHLTLSGQLWVDKPPLAIWVTAVFYHLFGITEFSARLFSALCGAGTVLATYFFGRRLFNRWAALCGALILLSSMHFLRFARFGMLDAPFTFFLTLALFFFWLGQSRNRFLIFSGIAIGLAFLTKGFAAVLIFIVIWTYCACSDRMEILGRSSYWIGVMVAVAIALPWNLYELVSHHDRFMNDIVLKHLFFRTTTALEGHAGGYYFYIRTLINKYHPWILLGIFSGPYFLYRAIRRKEGEFIFVSAWMFGILAVITLMRTKLPWYVFPLYPALSLAIGHTFSDIFKEKYALFVRTLFVVVLTLHIPYSGIFNADYSPGLKHLAPIVHRQTDPSASICFYKFHDQPAGVFYFERLIVYADSPEEFSQNYRDGRRYFLARESDLGEIESVYKPLGFKPIAKADELVLIASAPS